jgi:hypothetical protein
VAPCTSCVTRCSSEISVHTRSTWHHIPENGILHSHHHENLKSYIEFILSKTKPTLQTMFVDIYFVVSRFTALADLVRTIQTNHSLQTSNCTDDLTKPPSSVSSSSVPKNSPSIPAYTYYVPLLVSRYPFQ